MRWKINAVTVVNNNGGGNQSKRGFDRVYGGQQTEQAYLDLVEKEESRGFARIYQGDAA